MAREREEPGADHAPEERRASPLAAISNRVVQLHKEYYGRGPTRAKTYQQEDLVVVLMRGGFTKVEETLLRQGRGEAVTKQRMEFQEVMVDRFKNVVEEELGREVIGFMSGSQQDPDLIAEIFVLAPEHDGELLGEGAGRDGE